VIYLGKIILLGLVLFSILGFGATSGAFTSGYGWDMMDGHHGMMGDSGSHMMHDDEYMHDMHEECEGHMDENCEYMSIEECEEEYEECEEDMHEYCEH
jgi:hypothetical protein